MSINRSGSPYSVPSRRHPGPVHGHAGGHLRDRLIDWIEWRDRGAVVEDDDDAEIAATDIVWLLGKLWNCTDIVPGDVRRSLDVERDFFTYGQMARLLKPIVIDEIDEGLLEPGSERRW